METSPAERLDPQAVIERVRSLAGDDFVAGRVHRGDPIGEFRSGAAATLARALQRDGTLHFETLVDVTAVHWPLDAGRELEVVYHYRSLRNNLLLRVKTRVPEDGQVPSLAGVFAAARWLEREAYDLMGVRFEGHPNLKRILLPEGYEGYPLLKDYPVEGPSLCTSTITIGISLPMAKEMCSLYRLRPGPDVAVMTFSPAMDAPRQEPIEAISSSP